MPRGNWNVTISGTCLRSAPRDSPAILLTGFHKDVASETVSGVARHKPSGWIPPTGYSMYHRTIRYQQGTCDYVPRVNPNTGKPYSGEGQYYSGVVGPPNSSSGRFVGSTHFDAAVTEANATSVTGLANESLIAARLNLKSKKIDLGVAFAERKQTAMLLGDTAKRLATSVTLLKQGRVRPAMDALGISHRRQEPRGSNWPKKWLELQYGWNPFLSDVYGAADALSKRSKGDWRVTAKATRSRNQFYEVSKEPKSNTNFDAHRCRAKVMRSAFTRIDALPANEATISLSSLGITNPLLIAWELVPYSFVVDWCLPIGNWLDSLDAMLGYTDSYVSTSVFVKAEWTDEGLSGTFSTGGWTRNNFSGSKRVVSLVRTASSGVPLPSIPRIKDPISLGHMANGLALLSQAFGRR